MFNRRFLVRCAAGMIARSVPVGDTVTFVVSKLFCYRDLQQEYRGRHSAHVLGVPALRAECAGYLDSPALIRKKALPIVTSL